MVIAHQDENAAIRRGARHIAMLEHVAGTVNARPLAVPDAEDAIEIGLAEHGKLLRAPDAGRGQILVHARLEMDIVVFQERLRLPQGLVIQTERRAAIARNKTAGFQTGGGIALTLHNRNTDERLRPGDKHLTALQFIFVIQADSYQIIHS